jgi:hypothetical protein
MFGSLFQAIRSRLRRTRAIYCVRCRDRRQVVVLGYDIHSVGGGRQTRRLRGRCTSCEGKTSTFVAM